MEAITIAGISRDSRFVLAPDLEIIAKEKESRGRKYYCRLDKRYFYIGPMLGDLLFRLRQGENFWQVLVETADRYDMPRPEFASIVRERLIERGLILDTRSPGAVQHDPAPSYIKAQVPLLGERAITSIAGLLRNAFHPAIALVLLGFAAFSYSLLFIEFGREVLSPGRLAIVPMLFDGSDYLLFIAAMLGIYLFHEFGHAAAARYHNVRIRRVGFGIYVVFPVFFTDISDAWAISTRKRVVLNLGGVYFQLLISLVAVWAALTTRSEVFLFILMVNFWSMTICMLPFVRFDGYWIYSDLFNIPNLWDRAFEAVGKIVDRGRKGFLEALNAQIEESPELMAYCLTSFVFLCVFSVVIFRAVMTFLGSVGSTTEQIWAIVSSPASGLAEYGTAFFHTLFLLFVALILTVLSRNILKAYLAVITMLGMKRA